MARLTYRQAGWLSVLAGLLVFAVDRAHKHIQIDLLGWSGGEYVPVTGFFDYVLIWNTGVSWGMLDDFPMLGVLALSVVAILALAAWWYTSAAALVRFGLALCLGGALSNALDRLLWHAVADFFHFHWAGWSFYVFNIADAAITIGVGLLIVDMARPRAPSD